MSRPSSHSESRQAQQQLAWCVLMGAIAGLVSQLYALAPASADRLRVTVGELRSQAAELELVQREVLDGRLSAHFTRRDLQQLGEDSARSFAALTRLNVPGDLADAHMRARRAALGIQLELADLAADGTPRPDGARELRERLSTLEQSLRR